MPECLKCQAELLSNGRCSEQLSAVEAHVMAQGP